MTCDCDSFLHCSAGGSRVRVVNVANNPLALSEQTPPPSSHVPYVPLTLFHLSYTHTPSHSFTYLSRRRLSSDRGMGVEFGSFNSICQTAALVICPWVGSDQGIEPSCYSRNVDIAGTLIFQPCESLSPIYERRWPKRRHTTVNPTFFLTYLSPPYL